MTDYTRQLIAIAVAQLGVREHGRNRGPEVESYLAATGSRPGSAWCAAFQCWLDVETSRVMGVPCRFPISGAVTSIWRKAKASHACLTITAEQARENPVIIKAGDVWLRAGDEEHARLARESTNAHRVYVPGHCGRVVLPPDVYRRTIDTIEGNTNQAGSREGDGVYQKVQSIDDDRTIGFVRLLPAE